MTDQKRKLVSFNNTQRLGHEQNQPKRQSCLNDGLRNKRYELSQSTLETEKVLHLIRFKRALIAQRPWKNRAIIDQWVMQGIFSLSTICLHWL